MTARLSGRRVVVTRAAGQARRLSELLQAEGAEVVEVPTIAVLDPDDGGVELREALARVGDFDWVVVTSVNGAERVAGAIGARGTGRAQLAAVGPGTAGALRAHGLAPALVPARHVAEGLLDELPRPATGRAGRILLAQADRARPVLADGLRARGWQVDAVTAYRTVAVPVPAALVRAARAADAIAFTSASTVSGFLDGAGADALPPVVVAMGPVTAEAARRRGVTLTRTAEPHTLEGLVAALVQALSGEPAA